ncbi:hypothetical protein GCM10011348_16550 [Marinobacterium nitratireducens]|uniref:Uncharacterized protein n=1 Tax=Marinobacterium nitratireducens TaxID=518897 RepID=A0A917ZCE2_9GAMM|nr:hypothetical protein GCM10011348_16550 [Marinobacterium nitratireducens]
MDTATDRVTETPPAPPVAMEAATRVASMVAPSWADRNTSPPASISLPPVTEATTVLVVVILESTPVPEPLTDTPPEPPMVTAAATPVAVMLMRSARPRS